MPKTTIMPPMMGSTFLKCPSGTIEDLDDRSVAIVGVPYEATKVSRPGCMHGPRAVREATYMFAYLLQCLEGAEMYEPATGEVIRSAERYDLWDLGDLGLYPADVHVTSDIIAEALENIVDRDAFPVMLGGDHYISYPCLRGFAAGMRKKNPDIRIGYVHVDAHLDLADEMPFFGKFSSGTQVRRIMEIPGIDPKNMILLGIGGVQPKAEWDFAVRSGISIITRNEMQAGDLLGLVRDGVSKAVDDCDTVYVTLCIDVNDRTFAPGTGNAVATGGLVPSQFLDLMKGIRECRMGAVDLVEVAPNLDPTGRTASLAASALMAILSDKLFEITIQ